MPRYFEPVSVEGLKEKILSAWQRHEDYEDMRCDVDDGMDGMPYNQYKWLTPTIAGDLSKVDFSAENCTDGRDSYRTSLDSWLGYHTLDNGFTFLGCMAGGDWEIPLFFLIYWDGKKLRAYVPEGGNAWNTDTYEAYGNGQGDEDENGEDADDRNIRARYSEQEIATDSHGHADNRNLDLYDPAVLIEDIKARIRPRP